MPTNKLFHSLRKFVLSILIIHCYFISYSQYDSSFNYSVSSQILLANNKPTPHWLISNKYGIYNDKKCEGIALMEINKNFFLKDKWKIESGALVNVKSEISNSYLHNLFFNIQYGNLKLITGMNELSFSQYSDKLSSGSFYVSNNCRPIPRIGIGFYEYVDVPFTNGYIQIKGFVNQGILNDNRGELGTQNPLLHEKIFYIRTNNLTINPHVGLNHSALFGGTNPDGVKIPADYFATFFGKGSKLIGGGELTNAAGAHLGLFDFGFNTSINDIDFTGYFQKPFTDRSGVNGFFKNNRDFLMGLTININNNNFIQEVVFESISTTHQGGEGLTDPKIGGKMYYPGDEIDKDKIMLDIYGIEVENISDEEFWRFIRRMENYGYQYGGRDNYYNNGMYYKSWSYHDYAIGNSLFLTIPTILKINQTFDPSYDLFFANTRIVAYHFGIRGTFNNISYLLKTTFSYNYGTYSGLNKGNKEWDSKNPYSDYDYFFEYGLAQYYTALDLHYTLPKNNNLVLNLSLGADFGEMYNSFGCIAGITYNGIIPTRKKSSD